MRFRTIERELFFKSSCDLVSVLYTLEQSNIHPKRVVRAMKAFVKIGIPPNKIANALALVFNKYISGDNHDTNSA